MRKFMAILQKRTALNNDGTPVNFPGNSASFKLKQKTTGSTGNDGTKASQMMVPLKYLGNFWKTLEMSLINCEINLILTWSANCVMTNAAANQATIFPMTDTKLYVPILTLSTQDYAKPLQQLKSRFKRTVNCNKHYSKAEQLNAPTHSQIS